MPVKKDVLIGLPCYDNRIHADILQECLAAVSDPECVVAGIQYYNGDSLIPRGRNKIVKMFLDSDSEYLMFIDSDIKFDRNMINLLRSHNKGICGGIYLKKTIPYTPVMNHALAQEDNLFVMREIGTGFMMIRRDVFGAMKTMWPEHNYRPDDDEQAGDYHDWFRIGVRSGRYLSEDYYFCQLAAELGYKTYLDPSIMVVHYGQMSYPMDDTQFIKGATLLLDRLRTDANMNVALFEDVIKAAQKQINARGEAKSVPDNVSMTLGTPVPYEFKTIENAMGVLNER